MVAEEDIAKFPPDMQGQIRARIAECVSPGYSADHLMLCHDGDVIFDPEEATDALQRARWGREADHDHYSHYRR